MQARRLFPTCSVEEVSGSPWPFVTATAYSVIEFPDLIRRYRVTGVPKIVVGEGVELLGAQPESVFVDAVVAVGTSKAVPPQIAKP